MSTLGVAIPYASVIIGVFVAMVAALSSAFRDNGQLRTGQRQHFIPTPVVDMVVSHRWAPRHRRGFWS